MCSDTRCLYLLSRILCQMSCIIIIPLRIKKHLFKRQSWYLRPTSISGIGVIYWPVCHCAAVLSDLLFIAIFAVITRIILESQNITRAPAIPRRSYIVWQRRELWAGNRGHALIVQKLKLDKAGQTSSTTITQKHVIASRPSESPSPLSVWFKPVQTASSSGGNIQTPNPQKVWPSQITEDGG